MWAGRCAFGPKVSHSHIAARRSPTFVNRPKSDELVEAASHGHFVRMKELLASGVSPGADSDGDDGVSALSAAASNGQLAATQLLLSKGADVNDDDFWGGNALVGASLFGHVEVVRLLLAHGADPNMQDDGVTALDYASHQLIAHETAAPLENYFTIVRLLKDAGAQSSNPFSWFLGL